MITDFTEDMFDDLPKRTRYLSYSYMIPYQPLEVIFAKASAYKGTRFFWQTPDRQFGLVGLGKNLLDEPTIGDVLQIKQLKKEFFKSFYFMGERKERPVLFGGFPFNKNNRETEAFWADLSTGYFVLPSVLIKQVKKELNVVITVKKKGKSLKRLFDEITDWVQILDQLLEKVTPSFPQTQVLLEKELDVTTFLQSIKESVEEIRDPRNPMEKVVLARQMDLRMEHFSVERLIDNLIRQQANTYVFALETTKRCFVGATPEHLLHASATHFFTASIAGSTTRGKNDEEDRILGEKLLKNSKNNNEHAIVVKKLTKQLANYTEGNLSVSNKKLLKNRDIQHLYLTISGIRKPKVSLFDVIQALHPSPALGGEPKELAIQWLAKKEPSGIGLYGAPIGWCDVMEDIGEFAVGIRSGVFSENSGRLYAGCGIVGDSDPEEERQETQLKFQPMLRGVKE